MCDRGLPPGRRADGPWTHAAASRRSDCPAACGPDIRFLGVHGPKLHFCPKRPFGPKLQCCSELQFGPKLQLGPKRPGSRSECAGLLAPLGNDGVSRVASGQPYTAQRYGERQARHPCG